MKRWAILTVALYGIILVMLSFPLLLLFGLDHDAQAGWHQSLETSDFAEAYSSWWFYLWLGIMMAGQALLLLVPLDIARERPTQRRWLRVPVLRLPHGSGSGIEAWQQEAALLSPLANAWLSGPSLKKPC